MNLLLSLCLLVVTPTSAQVIRQNGNAIGSANIIAGAVDTNAINTDAVTTVKIINGAVNTPKLATDAVTTVKVLTGAIDTRTLASDAVITAKMLTGAVDTRVLASDSVTTPKILTSAVETSKLASDAVTSAKLLRSGLSMEKVSGGVTQMNNSIVLDNAGPIRSTVGAAPIGGAGTEINYNAGTGTVQCYDRDGTAFCALALNGTKVAISNGADTAKIHVGDATHAACLMLGDSDNAGCTECVPLNGVLTCGVDADCVCDGTP